MEYSGGRHEEEWKDNDTTGMGRSYECVFCKRGFTTAQALGGHMNIHRKDRAKNGNNNIKPSTNPSTGLVATHDVSFLHKKDDTYKSYSPALQSYPLHGYFPVSAAAQYCHGQQDTYHYGTRVVEDCSWSLSLQVGSSKVDDLDHDDEDGKMGFVEGDQELDLELRLGHGHGRA